MHKEYWRFILGLQYNAQRYFDNQIIHYETHHAWTSLNNDLLFVRDFETNELLYDATDHLIIDMHQQGIQSCKLIPFELLYPNFTSYFKQYLFEVHNYPLAIFLGTHQSFALVKIHTEKVKPLSGSLEPREFRGFSSTQNYDGYLLFTLLKLDPKQRQIIEQFIQPVNWKWQYEKLNTEFLNHPFNFKKDSSLTLTNNLSIHDYSNEYNLLNTPPPEFNLAFSLINKLESLQNEINTEISMSIQGRSSKSNFIDQNYSQIEDYQDQLNNAFVKFISHTANDFQNAYIDQEFTLIPKQSLNNTVNKDLNEQDIKQQIIEKNQISTLASTLYSILFIAIVIGLLYGIFWLISHYEFAKFTVITIVIIIFLAIWSNKS